MFIVYYSNWSNRISEFHRLKDCQMHYLLFRCTLMFLYVRPICSRFNNMFRKGKNQLTGCSLSSIKKQYLHAKNWRESVRIHHTYCIKFPLWYREKTSVLYKLAGFHRWGHTYQSFRAGNAVVHCLKFFQTLRLQYELLDRGKTHRILWRWLLQLKQKKVWKNSKHRTTALQPTKHLYCT